MHVVVMPWKDRTPYLRLTLATMEEAARGRHDVHVIIYNNGSLDDLPYIVTDLTWLKVQVRELPVTDCHYNYVNMLRDVFEDNEFKDVNHVITQDADGCIHPHFFDVADHAIDDLPDLGHFSFFNEDCHPEPTGVCKEIYHYREHISFFSTIIARAAWDAFPTPNFGDPMKDNCMDGNFSWFVHQKTPLKVYSTIRSYAEHIGMEGQHVIKRPDKEIIARARRFYA